MQVKERGGVRGGSSVIPLLGIFWNIVYQIVQSDV